MASLFILKIDHPDQALPGTVLITVPHGSSRAVPSFTLSERIILRNPQGHLLFSSNWFGGNKVYREPNWQWQKPYSFPVLHPAFLLGQYN
ncbi:hypothetical protein, partial [Mesorhizobium sp. M8A.F.Ca.ET.161.01.1.1]|uniref:hypothetical protein n=1 Tax=Mesorhizobium sp. M8A.F.Ca.ET.161.01.1.1 TaxID=2563959 RepID=UPI00167A9BA3